jgi:hypothetical protein
VLVSVVRALCVVVVGCSVVGCVVRRVVGFSGSEVSGSEVSRVRSEVSRCVRSRCVRSRCAVSRGGFGGVLSVTLRVPYINLEFILTRIFFKLGTIR